MVRTALLGEIERLVGAVDHNDFRRTERRENLDANMPKSAGANHRDIFARQQMAGRFLGGAIGGQPGVGVWSDIFRRQRLGQLDEGALAREQVLRVTAVCVDTRKRTIQCVHVIAAPASQAMPAGHQRMTNDAVANLYALDARPDRLDPAGIFMTHDVRKFDVNLTAPNAFDNMQICATDARTADTYDHVHRARNL